MLSTPRNASLAIFYTLPGPSDDIRFGKLFVASLDLFVS